MQGPPRPRSRRDCAPWSPARTRAHPPQAGSRLLSDRSAGRVLPGPRPCPPRPLALLRTRLRWSLPVVPVPSVVVSGLRAELGGCDSDQTLSRSSQTMFASPSSRRAVITPRGAPRPAWRLAEDGAGRGEAWPVGGAGCLAVVGGLDVWPGGGRSRREARVWGWGVDARPVRGSCVLGSPSPPPATLPHQKRTPISDSLEQPLLSDLLVPDVTQSLSLLGTLDKRLSFPRPQSPRLLLAFDHHEG